MHLHHLKQPLNVISLIAQCVYRMSQTVKQTKIHLNNEIKDQIKHLNTDIRMHVRQFKNNENKKNNPRRSKSLWKAVKIAKNVNIPKLRVEMTLTGTPIDQTDLPDAFASFFKEKVQLFVNQQKIDDSVHNGNLKMRTTNLHFMSSFNNIIEAIKTLKQNIVEVLI